MELQLKAPASHTPSFHDYVKKPNWSAFWFETPFVIMKGIMPIGLYLGILLVIYYSYRISRQKLKSRV